MTTIIKTYEYLFKEAADARVNNWPLMSDPWGCLAIVVLYLYAIYVYLPKYMKDRQPYELKEVIKMYNIYQLIICPILVHGVLTSGWTTHYSLDCEPVDYSNNKMAVRMAGYVWLHFMIRVTELIETVFFVLRKKFRQVSPLHVYHHVSSVVVSWMVCKYVPGGLASFPFIVNPSVHVLMYAYYLLSSFGPKMQRKLEKFKPILTVVQLVQLIIILLYSLQIMVRPSCHMTTTMKFIFLFHVPNIIINIGFFIKFYAENYTKAKKTL